MSLALLKNIMANKLFMSRQRNQQSVNPLLSLSLLVSPFVLADYGQKPSIQGGGVLNFNAK